MARVAAVLFDLDGTLVDTERESAEGMARCLAVHGIEADESDRAFVIGHSWNEIHERLRGRYRLALSMEELIQGSAIEREAILRDGVRTLPGAIELVGRLRERVPLGLVTGSSRREMKFVIERLGIASAFGATIASEDVPRGKPDPAGFLRCAGRLGAAPDACLAFEDSEAGIRAARDAGMTCVAARAGNFAGHDQQLAHHHVASLADVSDELLSAWGVP